MKILVIEREVPGIKDEQYLPHLKKEALKLESYIKLEKFENFIFPKIILLF